MLTAGETGLRIMGGRRKLRLQRKMKAAEGRSA